MKIKTNIDGSASLYSLLLVPLALTLTVLGVDVAGWNTLRNTLQREADRLALHGSQLLPDQALAKKVVEREIGLLPLTNINAEVLFKGQRAEVRLSASYQPSFAILLGNSKEIFKVARRAVAEILPGDYAIVFNDSSSLRPGFKKIGNTPGESVPADPWGNSLDWPASSYFSCVSNRKLSETEFLDTTPLWDWWNHWNDTSFQRWATQSCFNPALSPLKYAAISLVDAISASAINRLSLIFTPGDLFQARNGREQNYSVSRFIHGEVQTENGGIQYPSQLGGFLNQEKTAESLWYPGVESEMFLGNEACVLFSHPHSTTNAEYQLQVRNNFGGLEKNGFVGNTEILDLEVLDSAICGSRHYPFGNLSKDYLEQNLKIREAIYWHAAKLQTPERSAKPNLREAIRQAFLDLVDLRHPEALRLEKEIRGNLAGKARKRIFVFTDSLPSVDREFLELIAKLQDSKVDLIFLAFKHQYLSSNAKKVFDHRLEQLRQLENSKKPLNTNPLLKIFATDSAKDLQGKILPYVASLNKQSVLRI